MKKFLTVMVMAGMVFSAADAALAKPRGRSENMSPAVKLTETRVIKDTLFSVDTLPDDPYTQKKMLSYLDINDIRNYDELLEVSSARYVMYINTNEKVTPFFGQVSFAYKVLDEKVKGLIFEVTRPDGPDGPDLEATVNVHTGQPTATRIETTVAERFPVLSYNPDNNTWESVVLSTGQLDKYGRVISGRDMKFPNGTTELRFTAYIEDETAITATSQRPGGGSEGGAGAFNPVATITDSSVPLADTVDIIDEDVPLAEGLFGLDIPLNSFPLVGENNMIAMLFAGLGLSLSVTGASAVTLRKCKK